MPKSKTVPSAAVPPVSPATAAVTAGGGGGSGKRVASNSGGGNPADDRRPQWHARRGDRRRRRRRQARRGDRRRRRQHARLRRRRQHARQAGGRRRTRLTSSWSWRRPAAIGCGCPDDSQLLGVFLSPKAARGAVRRAQFKGEWAALRMLREIWHHASQPELQPIGSSPASRARAEDEASGLRGRRLPVADRGPAAALRIRTPACRARRPSTLTRRSSRWARGYHESWNDDGSGMCACTASVHAHVEPVGCGTDHTEWTIAKVRLGAFKPQKYAWPARSRSVRAPVRVAIALALELGRVEGARDQSTPVN